MVMFGTLILLQIFNALSIAAPIGSTQLLNLPITKVSRIRKSNDPIFSKLDYSYITTVEIGSEKQQVQLEIDPFSYYVSVPKSFKVENSKTFSKGNIGYDIESIDGTRDSGVWATDTFQISDDTNQGIFSNFTFGYSNDEERVGVLGLAASPMFNGPGSQVFKTISDHSRAPGLLMSGNNTDMSFNIVIDAFANKACYPEFGTTILDQSSDFLHYYPSLPFIKINSMYSKEHTMADDTYPGVFIPGTDTTYVPSKVHEKIVRKLGDEDIDCEISDELTVKLENSSEFTIPFQHFLLKDYNTGKCQLNIKPNSGNVNITNDFYIFSDSILEAIKGEYVYLNENQFNFYALEC